MKYTLSLIVASLLLFFSHQVWAETLTERLALDHTKLDQSTGSQETDNRVSLLHLGKSSLPVRKKIIAEAQQYIFTSVPYWYDDKSGQDMYDTLADRLHSNPLLQLRVLEDWTSPGSTGDFWATKMFHKLEKLSHGNAMLWNTPWWGRSFSLDIVKNRLHDKVLIIDGKKMITGGMNIGNEYLEGGLTRDGWHDTDILIEGPAAALATRTYIKVWEMARYLSNLDNLFPDTSQLVRQTFEDYFYHDKESLSFRHYSQEQEEDQVVGAEIPYVKSFQAFNVDGDLSRLPPALGSVPVRLIYDNPLFNEERKGGVRSFCNFQCVLEYLFSHTQKTIRIFHPYLTLSQAQEKLFLDTARRGIKIEIITNSLASHDLGAPAYFAAISHYPKLLAAGIKIYEWQGHKPLLAMEKQNNCILPIGEWPGATVHTKAVVLDDEVGVLGSHNINVRSEKFNSEIMTLVSDPAFASQLNNIFESDLDSGPDPRTVACGEKILSRPRRVMEIDLPTITAYIRSHRTKVDFYKNLQEFM